MAPSSELDARFSLEVKSLDASLYEFVDEQSEWKAEGPFNKTYDLFDFFSNKMKYAL